MQQGLLLDLQLRPAENIKCSFCTQNGGPAEPPGSPTRLPRLVLLVVGAGLDVSCQFNLHVPKERNHLELLYSKDKASESLCMFSHQVHKYKEND